MTEVSERVSASRVQALDGLRGLCACVVVAGHALSIYPSAWRVINNHAATPMGSPLFWVFKTPLALCFAGMSAVYIFFVLSGLVLAKTFIRTDGWRYWPYLIKRVARIWPPYVVAIVLSAMFVVLTQAPGFRGPGDWLRASWTTLLRPDLLFSYALMTGRETSLDNVVWSLIHEIRVSILFPVIVWVAVRYGWRAVIAASGLSLAAALTLAHAQHLPWVVSQGFQTTRYLYLFVAGAALHTCASTSRTREAKAGPWRARACWALGLGLIFVATSIDPLLLNTKAFVLAGAGAILVVAQSRSPQGLFRAALVSQAALWTGRISYSLYLIHWPVLIVTSHLLSEYVSRPAIMVISIAISFAGAALMNRYIELNAQRFGRWLARARPKSPSAEIAARFVWP